MTKAKESLKSNGLLLKSIPAKERTEELCRIAVHQNPRALKYVPYKLQSESLCKEALDNDLTVFKLISERALTEQLCIHAVKRDYSLLEHLDSRFLTRNVCLAALSISIEALRYIPFLMREEICEENNEKLEEASLAWIQKDISASKFLPTWVRKSHKILNYQKTQDCLILGKRFYNPEKQLFCIDVTCFFDSSEATLGIPWYEVTATYSDFDEFYDFLDGDLSGALLQHCSFEGIDLHQYDISEAVIHSDVLVRQGLYDDSYFETKIAAVSDPSSILGKNELALPDGFHYPSPIDDGHMLFDIEKIPVFYISDIHLLHRIRHHFKERATREEIYAFIQTIAEKMVNSVGKLPLNSFLLIGGDTSSVFEFTEVFYKELVKHWNRNRIIAISGNHELWDPAVDMVQNINIHRTLLDGLGINYLQNDLLCVADDMLDIKPSKRSGASSFKLNEAQILSMTPEELRAVTKRCPFLILGGIGFSGYNEEYNATNVRYGYSFDSLSRDDAKQKDVAESMRFATVYKKLANCVGDKHVIVLTHMPKNDWNNDPYVPGWIYVNGHNHRNYSESNDQRTIYADNQIGYYTETIGIKYFYLSNECDVFSNYRDGRYIITAEQYTDFNRGKQISLSFNRTDGRIHMLKKNGIYMFLFFGKHSPNAKKENLFLLNGGSMRKLNARSEADISYYFDNLELYVNNIHLLIDRYTGVQKRLSQFIKNLGGSGKIHGCIIDVDMPIDAVFSYTHVFVNPIDGTVTPYYARNVASRIVYKDFKSLLENNEMCKKLLANYNELEAKNTLSFPVLRYGTDITEWGDDDSVYDEGGYLYQMSRIIKSLQYCTEKNIIRIWNDNLLNHEFVAKAMISDKAEDVMNDGLIATGEDRKPSTGIF